MGSLLDILKVDGVDYPLAEYFNIFFATALRAEFANTETITATKELTDEDYQIQILTPSGANRDVELAPEAASNHITIIYNASASLNLVVKDDSGAVTFDTIPAGGWATCIPILGIAWKVSVGTNTVPWTPTWTNLTVGNGTLTANYAQAGKLVVFQLQLVLGTTSSVGSSPHFTLPVASIAVPKNTPNGVCRYLDSSAAVAFQGIAQIITSSLVCRLFALDASGTYLANANVTATVPFAWASSDEIEVSGYYLTA